MSPHEFFDRLRAFCDAWGGSISSYGRTTAHNRDVGGVAQSAHRFWVAADVVYDPPIPAEGVVKDSADRLDLRLVREGDHDHLEPRDWRRPLGS